MTTTPPLSLSDIVDISVTVAPTAASANPFNQGLFIGPSTVIPSYGANSRIRQYAAATFSTAMLTDGFLTSDPEYIAATIYFSQTPQPSFIWIGRQDLTAISAATPTSGFAGTGYAVGDVVGVTQIGASQGELRVAAISSGGVVTSLSLIVGQQGTSYTTATGLATTAITGSGTGLEVDITANGESLLQAATVCRAANQTWYGLAVNNPSVSDNLALAEWADPLWQNTRYYAWSGDLSVPNNSANNVAAQLQTLKLRCLGITSTTQSGLYPNNIYAAAGLMGVEMGLNTGLDGSFFTVAHKQIAGISVEPLSETQYSNVKTLNWNVYGNFSPYQFLEPGFLSNGSPSYLWLFLAVLVANLQLEELNVLAAYPAVSQTNADQQLLLGGANAACAKLAAIGFLSSANWEGRQVLNLKTGQALPLGYLNQSQPYAQQSPSDRAAGKAMPIYCCITTAGAVQSLAIAVYTQL